MIQALAADTRAGGVWDQSPLTAVEALTSHGARWVLEGPYVQCAVRAARARAITSIPSPTRPPVRDSCATATRDRRSDRVGRFRTSTLTRKSVHGEAKACRVSQSKGKHTLNTGSYYERQVIRTHPDLIGEHHPLPLDASPLTQVRPGLIDPLLLGPGVGLARAPVRALKGQPQAAQDLAYAPVGEGGAEQVLDHGGDLDGGPQGAAHPQLVGLVLHECSGQSLLLVGGELGVLARFAARPARA